MLATIVCGVGPNGMAQRQRRGRGDTFAIIAHFWQIAPARERRSRCPLESARMAGHPSIHKNQRKKAVS